jgi:hypothetical protein
LHLTQKRLAKVEVKLEGSKPAKKKKEPVIHPSKRLILTKSDAHAYLNERNKNKTRASW